LVQITPSIRKGPVSKVLGLDLSQHNFTSSGNPGVLVPCVTQRPQAPAQTAVTPYPLPLLIVQGVTGFSRQRGVHWFTPGLH